MVTGQAIAKPLTKRREIEEKELAEGIRELDRVGRNLSKGSARSKARELFNTGMRLHGSWRKAVEAQGIDYGEHVRRWMQSHRRGGKQELTKERLFDLIEERWRSDSGLNPEHEALGGAKSAASRLFPPRAGSWKRAVTEAAKARKLRIASYESVLKKVPGKWNKEKIGAAIRRLYEAGKPLTKNYAQKKHVRLWGAAERHYRGEGGWKAAVKDEGIDYDALLPDWIAERRKNLLTPLRDPDYFSRAFLDRQAEAGGGRMKLRDFSKTNFPRWVAFHGGLKKAHELAEKTKQELGENEKLALAVRAGDAGAEKRLLEINKGFLVGQAGRFRGKGVDFPDLMQLVQLGFVEAARKFKAVKNAKLITYAPHIVRQTVQREAGGLGEAKTMRLPFNVLAVEKPRLYRETARVAAERGGRLGDEAKQTLLGSRRAVERVAGIKDTVSLSAPIRKGEEGSLEMLVGRMDETALRNVENGLVRQALDRLEAENPRYALILRRRFGIGSETEEEETLEEVSRDFGVTRERIRQLEKEALKRMRELLSAKK